jgi:hypothetical protein
MGNLSAAEAGRPIILAVFLNAKLGHDGTIANVPLAPPSTGEAMPIKSKYLFVVSMDIDPDKEALFNEVYDSEHVPNLLQVPGFHAAARMVGEPFVLAIGGEEKRIAQDGPRYTVIYEIDGPRVLVSREMAQASEKGRWPGEVRPYTRNRRHALYKLR